MSDRRRRRRWLRLVGIGVVSLAAILLIVGFLMSRYLGVAVDARRLEALVNYSLEVATDGLYEAHIGGVDWGLGGLSLRLDQVSLVLDTETLERRDRAGTTPRVLFQLRDASIRVIGVDLWSLLRDRGFRAQSLTIDRPLIQISGLDKVMRSGTAETPSAEGRSEPIREEAEGQPTPPQPPTPAQPKSAPRVQIRHVALTDVSLENYRRRGAEKTLYRFDLFERFGEIDIELADLDLSDARTDRLLFARDVSAEIRNYYYLWPNGLQEERHGRIRLSTAGGYIRAEDLSYRAIFERREHVRPDGSVPPAANATIDRIAVEGVDFEAIVNKRDFSADEFTIDGARLELTSDPLATRPGSASAGSATAPITEARPGALITSFLSDLPEIRVDHLRILDLDVDAWIDREEGEWLEAPINQIHAEDLHLELHGYVSGPEVRFDESRPFFAESASGSATQLATSLGDGRHRVVLDGWKMSDTDQNLSVAALSIEPLFDRRQVAAAGIEPPQRVEMHTGAISFTGIDYGDLVDALDIDIEEVRIEAPRLRRTVSARDESSSSRLEVLAGAEALAEVVSTLLLGAPNVSIRSFTLADGEYEQIVDRDEGDWLPTPENRLRAVDIDLRLEDWRHREGDAYDPKRPLLASRVSLGVGAIDLALPDGVERLRAHDVLVSSDSAFLTIGRVEVSPVEVDPGRLARHIREVGVVPRLTTGRIEATGSPLTTYLEGGGLEIDDMELHRPRLELLDAGVGEAGVDEVATADASNDGRTGAARLGELVAGLPEIRVGRFAILDARIDRYVGSAEQDWSTLPEALESIRSVDLTLEGFNTAERTGHRLLLSDRVELGVDEILLTLGASGGTLRLGSLALSSDSDSFTLGDAVLSVGGAEGDNRFDLGRVEIGHVPYDRLFSAVIEPPETAAPVIAAMIDENMLLDIEGIEAVLDGGKRLFRVGPVSGSAVRGSLRIAGASLTPTMPDADPSTPQTELPSDDLVLRVGDVEVSGLDFQRLARDGSFNAAVFRLSQPTVEIVRGIAVAPSRSARSTARDRSASAVVERIESAVARLPVVTIDQVRIDDIAVRERTSLEGEPERSIDDVNLAVDGLDLRADREAVAETGVLYATDIRLHVPRQRTVVGKQRYELEVGPVDLSTAAGSLELGTLRYQMPDSAEAYLNRPLVGEPTRIEFVVDDLALEEIDLARLLRDDYVHIGRLNLSGWKLWVLEDQKKPKTPRVGLPVSPHRLVQGIPVLFAVDEIRLADGAFRYSLRSAKGQEPGHLWWDDMDGRILNVSNDPARMSVETPMELSLGARTYGEASLELDWRIPLLEPAPTMSYSARLSGLPAASLSAILLPTEGVRVRRGTFESIWLDVDIRDGHGTGSFNGIFRGVGVRLEDRTTGRRSLRDRLVTVVANIVLQSSNGYGRDGKPDRVGVVDYPVPESVSFFAAFWNAIKTGVIDLMI